MRISGPETAEHEKRFELLVSVRTGGNVERCHGIYHHGSYSVARHTWGVLALMWILFPDDYAHLSPYVLFHDVPEAWVGDIPAPVKKYSAATKNACDDMERRIFEKLGLPCEIDLPSSEKAKVKACDGLELYCWAKEQVHSGNLHARCILRELERFFEQTPLPYPADGLFYQIKNQNMELATDAVIWELNR